MRWTASLHEEMGERGPGMGATRTCLETTWKTMKRRGQPVEEAARPHHCLRGSTRASHVVSRQRSVPIWKGCPRKRKRKSLSTWANFTQTDSRNNVAATWVPRPTENCCPACGEEYESLLIYPRFAAAPYEPLGRRCPIRRRPVQPHKRH